MYLIIDETEEASTASKLTPAIRDAIRDGVAMVFAVEDGAFVWVDEDGVRNPLIECEWADDV